MRFMRLLLPALGSVLLVALGGCIPTPDPRMGVILVNNETNFPRAALTYPDAIDGICCYDKEQRFLVQAPPSGIGFEMTPGMHQLVLTREYPRPFNMSRVYAVVTLELNVEAGHRYLPHSAYDKARGFYFWISNLSSGTDVTGEINADHQRKLMPDDIDPSLAE